MISTDEQFNLLKQAEPHFESVKRDFLRNAPKWLTEQIINVYEIATKKTIFNKDTNCSICVMNIYKLIGKTYYSDKKEREAVVTSDKTNVTNKKTKRAKK